VVRTLALQLLTAGVTVVLARLLSPADYGLFAIALSIQLVGQNLAELGLPAALVRMPEEPTRDLQAAVIGCLFAVTAAIALAVLAASFLLMPALGGESKVLEVASVTLLALPLYATRAVPIAMMDRGMSFGRVALVETADTIAFNAFALTGALAGLGVFSLAGAVPVGALLGMVVAWCLQDSARRPRFDFARIKPLIGFGSQVSILGVLYLGRDLGYVLIISALAGAPVAGFYAMAKRLFSFPTAMAAAVSRVGLPTLSQSGADSANRTARMIGVIACVCALPLALVAGSIRPLITVILGTEWLPVEDIVLYGSLSMLLGASLSSSINSYRLSEAKPTAAVVAIAVELATGFVLVAALIGGLDETGIGIAMTVGTLAGCAVLLATSNSAVRAGVPVVVRAAAISAIAAAAGRALALSDDVAGLVLSLGVVGLVWLGLAAVVLRSETSRVLGMIRTLMPGLRSSG
jgi:O-antigen/teichoic acid export membrane protein